MSKHYVVSLLAAGLSLCTLVAVLFTLSAVSRKPAPVVVERTVMVTPMVQPTATPSAAVKKLTR